MRSLSLVLGGILATAATSLSQNAPPPDKTATVEGTVTNSVTGEPILRAHVSLMGFTNGTQQTFGALTDAAGKFSVTGLPPGSYSVQAERTGFTAARDRSGAYGPTTSLQAGDKTDGIKLKLIPDGSISGRVVDPDGEPLESIQITAESSNGNMNFGAVTDDKGEFRLGSLAPGKYRIRASKMEMMIPPEIRTDGSVEQHLITTWYPNSSDQKSASRVQVQPGADVTAIEIRMQNSPIVCISGTVAGAPKGAEHATIELRQGRSSRNGGVVRADGTFLVCRADPGTYRVAANWFSDGRVLRSAPVTVEVGASNLEHIDLRLIPPADIAGVVTYESEEAKQAPKFPQSQRAAQQTAPPKPPPRRLIVQNFDGYEAPRPVEIPDDGSFLLQDVVPAQYRVILSYGPGYIKSMRLGQTEMQGNLLDVRNGAAPGATLTISVALATGEISGKVSDDNGPAAHVMVALFQDDDSSWSPPTNTTRTSDDGSYQLTQVAPGKYKVVALTTQAIRPLQSLIDDYGDVIETIDLRDGDKVEKDLKLKAAPAQ